MLKEIQVPFISCHFITITFVYRAEVSQKAAEVDALNDQLTEERKRFRDLQWAMEKEKCRTGRTEESKREELEVRMEELLGLLHWYHFDKL